MRLLKNKFLFIIFGLSFLAVACEGTPEKAQSVVDNSVKCSADCGGQLAGNPEFRCDLYDSNEYTGGEIGCAYDTSLGSCQVVTTSCIAVLPAEEFQLCEGLGQGNCNEGMDCFAVSSTKNACLSICEDHTDCEGMTDGPGICIQLNPDKSYCFKKNATINETCGWDSYSLCADGQGACTPSKINLVSSSTGSGFSEEQLVDYRCKAICDPTGTDYALAACTGGTSCLKAPTGQIQGVESITDRGASSTANDITDYRMCDSASSDVASQCSAGFECTSLRFSSGTSGDYCTLFEHWCGEAATFCDAFDRAGMVRCAQQTPCNIAPDYDMCSVIGATDTPASTSCWGNLQIDERDLYPICIGSCENTTIFNSAGDDLKELDCGTGYTCKAPADRKELSYIHQSVVDSSYAEGDFCSDDTDCDTTRDFSCIQTRQGKSCNRPAKMCIVE